MFGLLRKILNQYLLKFKKSKIYNQDTIKKGDRVWLISDTHFGHRNLLRWCRKGTFKDGKNMNLQIIKNWNHVVKPRDLVFHLGDFGSYRYKKYLNGTIIFIRGNHDRKTWRKQQIIKYHDLTFLLIHNPRDHTDWFPGDWIIHGHTHINTPFVYKSKKRVNVSCEVINYRPINLDTIYQIIKESDKYLDDRLYL
jgi:calcineurin-like phosphoesterase family protein